MNVTNNYKCAQKDLYSVAKMGWANYALHQPELADYKAFYTPDFGTTALAAVNAAQALPDNQARGAISETERIELALLGDVCLKKMQFAKGYVESAYPNKDMWKPQFEALGADKYDAAAGEDWESMLMMNQSGSNYLNNIENNEKLSANNNMPATFVLGFDDAAGNFASKYAEFLASKDTSSETEAKILANNACYSTLTDMFRDAQRVFSDDAVKLAKFTFQNLLDSINPPVAGVSGKVKESETNVPVVAVIEAQKTGEVAVPIVVGADGSFSQQLAEGNYTLKVSAVGYVTQTLSLDLKLTGLKRLDIVMVKI